MNNTKFKYAVYSTIMIVFVMFNGCDSPLEPKVFEELTSENFFQTEEDLNAAVIALYSDLTTDWGGLYNSDPNLYAYRGEITTDALFSQFNTKFANFNWGPVDINPNNRTYGKVRSVAFATEAILNIEKSEAPDNVKRRLLAEAKTLRAWLMFALYDFFGPVPVIVDPEKIGTQEIEPRPSNEVYVAQMEGDLIEAIPDLGEKFNEDPQNWGRVSKGTARMLLLRLYMHEKRWVDAESIAREIIESNNYSLLSNYVDVFIEKRNEELIHAIPASGSSPNYLPTQTLMTDFRSSIDGSFIDEDGGWSNHWMPWSFYDTFSNNDERKNTIMDSYINANGQVVDRTTGMPAAMPTKFMKIEGNGPGFSLDHPVFRYAEVLLSAAEAINEQFGPTPEAMEFANQVRRRAGLEDWIGLSKEQLRDSLLAERGREFFSEGLRRQDLIRHGKFIEYAQQRPNSSNAQPFHVLFPIPEQVVIESNGVVEQNPGY